MSPTTTTATATRGEYEFNLPILNTVTLSTPGWVLLAVVLTYASILVVEIARVGLRTWSDAWSDANSSPTRDLAAATLEILDLR